MVDNVLAAFFGLGKNVNKVKGQSNSDDTQQGLVGEKYPELTLDMDNEALGKLTVKWEKDWTESDVFSQWQKQSGENEKYWLGQHYQKAAIDKTRPMVDNAIFQSLEVYLPQIINQDPEGEVDLDNVADAAEQAKVQYAKDLQNKLSNITGKIKLVNKLRKGVRHWAIYVAAIAKCQWDMDQNIPTVKLVRMAKIILDPNSTVDDDGYTGERLGEYRKSAASKILNVLKTQGGEDGAVKIITDLVGEDLGSEVGFIEWWTDEYMCWTIDGKVLLKKKNPYWIYATPAITAPAKPALEGAEPDEMPADGGAATGDDTQNPIDQSAEIAQRGPLGELPEQDQMAKPDDTEVPDENTPIEPTDDDEEEEMMSNEGLNHLKKPKMPFFILTFFNLGKQPIDDTSLIGQNLANQDILNKRNKQIDKNIDSMNGGMVVSLERSGLTKDQASGVTQALRKGGTVTIPQGAVGDAIARMSAPALPSDIFNNVIDTRNRIQDIFGTRGSNPAGLASDDTVRGKYLNKTMDTSRIGGGISEAVEQWAENILNFMVQMMYVYDSEYANGIPKPPVSVTIKPGSTLPKDKTTIANQAISLATEGKMATVDMFKALDMPNAEELAVNVWLETNAPEVLYASDPRVAQVLQQKQQAAAAAAQAGNAEAAKPPSMSIAFKDMPPEGQSQMAAKAGITLDPEAIAAHAHLKESAPATLPDTKNTGIITPNQQ